METARLILFTPSHPNSLIYIWMSSSSLCLGLPSDLFPSGFPTKTLYVFFPFHTCYMLRPSHLPRRNHLYSIWLMLQILKLPFTKFSQSSSHFLLLMHKHLPQHPILEHPHLCSCLNVTDQVSKEIGEKTATISLCNIKLVSLYSTIKMMHGPINISDRPSLTPIQNNKQNYSSVYCNLYVIRH